MSIYATNNLGSLHDEMPNSILNGLANQKKISQVLLSLYSEGYICIYTRNSEQSISLTKNGLNAVGNSYFKDKNQKLFWNGFRDYSLVIANIAVALIAFLAFKNNREKFSNKYLLEKQEVHTDSIESKLMQVQKEYNNVVNLNNQVRHQIDSLISAQK